MIVKYMIDLPCAGLEDPVVLEARPSLGSTAPRRRRKRRGSGPTVDVAHRATPCGGST